MKQFEEEKKLGDWNPPNLLQIEAFTCLDMRKYLSVCVVI